MMQIQVKFCRCVIALIMGALLVENAYGHSPLAVAVSANGDVQTGTVLSVRKVLRNPPHTPNTRYPQTHYYDLFFSVRVAEYTTPSFCVDGSQGPPCDPQFI